MSEAGFSTLGACLRVGADWLPLLPRAAGLPCDPFVMTTLKLLKAALSSCPFRPVVIIAPSGCCPQGPASLADSLSPACIFISLS